MGVSPLPSNTERKHDLTEGHIKINNQGSIQLHPSLMLPCHPDPLLVCLFTCCGLSGTQTLFVLFDQLIIGVLRYYVITSIVSKLILFTLDG